MKVRFMRIVLFFDLPTTSARERKIYATFRKNLIKDGFVMLQYSVYTKLVLNPTAAMATKERLARYKPSEGNIQLLTITEQQFARIECITGELENATLQTTERTVVL